MERSDSVIEYTGTAVEVVAPGRRTLMETSVDARLLYGRLKEMTEGDVVSWQDLNDTIGGREVRGAAKGYLDTARRMALRDNMVFDAIKGVGLKRMKNEEVAVTVGPATMGKIHRATRRGMKKLGTVRYDDLKRDEQNQYNTGISLMSTLHVLSSATAARRVSAITEQSVKPIAQTEVLKLFEK